MATLDEIRKQIKLCKTRPKIEWRTNESLYAVKGDSIIKLKSESAHEKLYHIKNGYTIERYSIKLALKVAALTDDSPVDFFTHMQRLYRRN